jgi:hypothetical protein
MRKLLKRWYFWLCLLLVLGLAGSVALILANAHASRITQANYDRIQDEMSWAGPAFMLVVVCAGYLLIPVEKARITQENYDKIQEGWSEKQVEDLLGSCTLHGNVIALSGRTLRMGGINPRLFIKIWSDDDGNLIRVWFDSGCVTVKDFTASNLSFWEKMKGRVQRRLKAVWP